MSSVARRARESEIVEASVRKRAADAIGRGRRCGKRDKRARDARNVRARLGRGVARRSEADGANARGARAPGAGRSDRVWGATCEARRKMPPFPGPAGLPAGAPPRRRARRGRQMRVRREAPPRRDAAEPWRYAFAPLGHAPLTRRTLRRATSLLGGIARIRQALRQAARSLRFSTWGSALRAAATRCGRACAFRMLAGGPGPCPRASDAATLPPPDARPQRGEPAGFCRRRGGSRDPRGGSARVRAEDGPALARTSRRDAPQRETAGLRTRACSTCVGRSGSRGASAALVPACARRPDTAHEEAAAGAACPCRRGPPSRA